MHNLDLGGTFSGHKSTTVFISLEYKKINTIFDATGEN